MAEADNYRQKSSMQCTDPCQLVRRNSATPEPHNTSGQSRGALQDPDDIGTTLLLPRRPLGRKGSGLCQPRIPSVSGYVAPVIPHRNEVAQHASSGTTLILTVTPPHLGTLQFRRSLGHGDGQQTSGPRPKGHYEICPGLPLFSLGVRRRPLISVHHGPLL